MLKKLVLMSLVSLSLFSQQPAQATSNYALFGQEIVYSASQHLGIPYVWGGESPTRGFDCSGLVKYTFMEYNIQLPHRADLQFNYGEPVNREELRPGDVVFFRSGGYPIGHVGIYVGEDKFIHAPRTGKPVQIDALSAGWYSQRYVGARRMMPKDY